MQIRTSDTGLSIHVIARGAARLHRYREYVEQAAHDVSYTSHESALACPFDEPMLLAVEQATEGLKGELSLVVLVGIGGSNLGAAAVYDAVRGVGPLQHKTLPSLVMLDTVSPGMLEDVRILIEGLESAKKIAVVVASKSGSTAEARVNAEAVFSMMSDRWGRDVAVARMLILADPHTQLARDASEQGVRLVPLPREVGGRWSVLSPVGLVPLSLLGLNVSALLEGGRAGVRAAVLEGAGNPAVQLAVLRAEYYALGYDVHDLFVFDPSLAQLGAWHRQLLAESMGKTSESATRVGITPNTLVGSTDLHSMGQLVFGGPRTRTTTFLSVPALWDAGPRHESPEPLFAVAGMEGKQAGALMRAIYNGTVASYRHEQLPFVEIELAAMVERELGAYMAIEMASVMYLAELLHVNAFDQPAVEGYKAETRRLLAGN